MARLTMSVGTTAPSVSPRPSNSLGKRALRGGAWATIGFGAGNAIRLGSNLILTRMLAPDAFGVMTITVAILTWINMLSDFGVKPSLIRSENAEDPLFLATARTVQALRSCGMGLLVIVTSLGIHLARELGAFPATSVYSDRMLPHFLQIVAFGIAANGFMSLQLILKERELSMSAVVKVELASQVVGVGAIIGLAWGGLGPYALPLGTTLGTFAKVALSYVILSGPRVGFAYSKVFAAEMFGYGKWLVVASAFGFVVNRGGEVLLGYFSEQTAFSLYSIAAMWVSTVRILIQQLIQKIGYPMFSEVSRERPGDRTRIYYRVRLPLDVIAVGCFVIAYLGCGPFFETFYPTAYHPVARYIPLCAVSLLLVPYNSLNTVLLSSGDSRSFSHVTMVPALALIAGVPLVFRTSGFDAAVVFISLIQLFALPFVWRFSSKVVHLRWSRELVMVLGAVAVSAWLVSSDVRP